MEPKKKTGEFVRMRQQYPHQMIKMNLIETACLIHHYQSVPQIMESALKVSTKMKTVTVILNTQMDAQRDTINMRTMKAADVFQIQYLVMKAIS
jgi:hypothetical protein